MSNPEISHFDSLLKQYRKEAGLSGQELVDRINQLGEEDQPKVIVTVSTLNRWENGICIPQENDHACKILLYLAKSLELSLEKTNCLFEAAGKNVIAESEQKRFYPDDKFPGHLTKNTIKFIETLLEHFDNKHPKPVILLSPFDHTLIIDTVFSHASSRYSATQRCHLTLPHLTENNEIYFSELAQRFGLTESVSNGSEFEAGLRKKLSTSKHYFLLVSRFENVSEERCRELVLCQGLIDG